MVEITPIRSAARFGIFRKSIVHIILESRVGKNSGGSYVYSAVRRDDDIEVNYGEGPVLERLFCLNFADLGYPSSSIHGDR